MTTSSGITITCDAYRDGVFQYSFSESGLSDSAVTTISMGNNVIIDALTCLLLWLSLIIFQLLLFLFVSFVYVHVFCFL